MDGIIKIMNIEDNPILFNSLTKQDQIYMLNYFKLKWTNEAKMLLLPQSITGHANEGHECFVRGNTRYMFPEVVTEDIVRSLDMDCTMVKEKRQEYIDYFVSFLKKIIIGKAPSRYVNEKGEPLFGIQTFSDIKIKNPVAILRSVYFGSRMDNYSKWRKNTEDYYGIIIGGGECIGINRKIAKEKGIRIKDLASESHSIEWIEEQVKEGLLCRNVLSSEDIISGYVRIKEGKGTSDGLAALLSGKLEGKDGFLGLILTDAVDTWDKYTHYIFENGQDEKLGDMIKEEQRMIKRAYPEFNLPTEEEVMRFIYSIAKVNFNNTISESQRYFLQENRRTGLCSLENYLKYLSGPSDSESKKIIRLKEELKELRELDNLPMVNVRRYIGRNIRTTKRLMKGYIPHQHIGHPKSKMTTGRIIKQFERMYKKAYENCV